MVGQPGISGASILPISNDKSVEAAYNLSGVGSNPSLILDSSQIKGTDAYEVFDSGTTLSYLNDSAIKAIGPGKHIIETGWIPPGTLRENMLLSIVFDYGADAATGGASPTKTHYGTIMHPTAMQGYIIRRNPKTKKEVSRVPLYYTVDNRSRYIGAVPRATNQFCEATQFYTFDPKFEYKIELWTSQELDFNQYISVDFMTFSFLEPGGWSVQSQYAFGSDPIHQPQNVILPINLVFNFNGTQNAFIKVQQARKGESDDSNRIPMLLNNVYGATALMDDNAYNDISIVMYVAYSQFAGYEVSFYAHATVNVTGSWLARALIFGSMSPIEA